jgi:uncharacterized protein YjbI with pentapeptide repeats
METAKNYSLQNLQGRSFKGEDLTGADFSYADIRSADFTNAILKGANFSYAKAGLQRRRANFLLGFSFLATSLLGFASGLGGFFAAVLLKPENIKQYVIPAVIALIVLAVLFIFSVRRGYAVAKATSGAKTTSNFTDITVSASLASAVLGTVVLGIAVFLTFFANTAVVVALIIFAGFVLLLAVFLAVAIAGALVVAGPLAVAIALAGMIAVAGAIARVLVVNSILNATEAIYLVVIGAVIVGALANYIGLRALAGADEFTWVRMIALNFAAIGGTSFQRADLTEAHFTQAILKNTDFRGANLTHTRFLKAKKLDQSRCDNVAYLSQFNLSVQELLVTGIGRGNSYIGVNLKGANLVGADLSNANFMGANLSEATLQGAFLEGASLTQIQAIGTDFTDAHLTGACLEAWNIDNTTNLDNVDCRWVYLLEKPKPGTDDRERRPSSGEFALGDFTKLFEEVLNTVDLIFRNGIDWKAFTYSFKQVQVENEGTELAIQSIENKGDGVVVVKVSVSDEANKAKIHREFTQIYEETLKVLEERYQAELKAKDEQITTYRQHNADMMETVRLLASRPVNTYQAKASTKQKSISGKLVILKLGKGDFNAGFTVTLQIGSDGDRPSTEVQGELPPAPEIPETYSHWQSIYLNLDKSWRIAFSAEQQTNVSPIEDCEKSAKILRDRINSWLNSNQFRPIKDVLHRKLDPSEEIRVIIQAENIQLRRLAWQLWDFFDNYPKAEVALSTPEYDRAEKSPSPILRTKVRILAILGNSAGIDIQKDRAILEQLPNAETTFLVEPKRREVDVQLWDEAGWDILFFAGHSSSEGEIGCISINQIDSLTIQQLKNALKAAVERGLKLAIFNSCDGLNLARDLADLQIPQIIVMREPVPDAVADSFLQYFLKAFAGGKSLYGAVREARERLEGLEDEFPCASWLPTIYQHLAEVPLAWEELRGVSAATSKSPQY